MQGDEPGSGEPTWPSFPGGHTPDRALGSSQTNNRLRKGIDGTPPGHAHNSPNHPMNVSTPEADAVDLTGDSPPEPVGRSRATGKAKEIKFEMNED